MSKKTIRWITFILFIIFAGMSAYGFPWNLPLCLAAGMFFGEILAMDRYGNR